MIHLIPVDIVLEILIKLPILSIQKLAQCNKKLNKICKSEYLWKCRYKNDYSKVTLNNWMNKYIKTHINYYLIPVYLIHDYAYSDGTFKYEPHGYLNRSKLRNRYQSDIYAICEDDSLIIFVNEKDKVELFTIIVNSKIYTFGVNSEKILDKNILVTAYIIKDPYNLQKYIKKLQQMSDLETTKRELLKLINIYIDSNNHYYINRGKFSASCTWLATKNCSDLQILNNFEFDINEQLLKLIKNKNEVISCKINYITSKGEIKHLKL